MYALPLPETIIKRQEYHLEKLDAFDKECKNLKGQKRRLEINIKDLKECIKKSKEDINNDEG